MQQGAQLANQYNFGANAQLGLGSQLANLYSSTGANMANLGVGAAAQNAAAYSQLANLYGAPTQYAGGELAHYANTGQQFLNLGTNLLGQAGGAAAGAMGA